MPRPAGQVVECLEEAGPRAAARVAPAATVLTVLLLVGRAEQGAAPLPGQGLPLEVVRGGLAPLAGAGAAAVLVDDHAAESLHAVGDPGAKRHAVGQLARPLRWRVADLHDRPGAVRP